MVWERVGRAYCWALVLICGIVGTVDGAVCRDDGLGRWLLFPAPGCKLPGTFVVGVEV